MDQKDANIQNAEQKQPEESHKVKKLASAAELRGSKSGKAAQETAKKGSRKMWLSLTAMIVVLALAAGICIAAAGFKPEEEPQNGTVPTSAPSTSYTIIERKRSDVSSVTMQLKGEDAYTITNTVTRIGEGQNAAASYAYGIYGIPEFDLNENHASAIISYAATLTAGGLIEENVTDFAPYGLDDPTLTFTINYANGMKDVLLFGKKVPASDYYYMCRQGERTVYVVYSAIYETLHTTLNELAVVNMPVNISDAAAIANILIEQKGKETIEVSYKESLDDTFSISAMKLVQPFEYDAQGDRVSELMTACAALNITTYAGEKSRLPEAGLEDPMAKIRVTDADGNVLNYIVGNHKDENSVYVQVDDSETVYLADASTLSFLNNVHVNYLIDQYVGLVNIIRVDEITVTAGENAYIMSIDRQLDLDANGNQQIDANGNVQTINSYYFDGAVITEDQFKDVYMNMIGIMMSKVSDNKQLEGDAVVRFSYTLNVEPYEFVIEFIEYDAQYYAVRRAGQTIALVKQDRVNNVLDQLAAFRGGSIDAD